MSRPSTFSVQTFLLAVALALLAAVPALVFAEAPKVDLARFDYGLRARALAEGVYVVEGANDDFTVANGCNIINTGFITTGAGVVVINTGTSKRYGEQLRALIARTTQEPVVQVVQLNLHPDYFLGNQGFADVPRAATPLTRAGVAREAAAYETNLYRLCGDWMLGTETVAPDRDTPATTAMAPAGSVWTVGQRSFELREFSGHTASDLVLIDRTSGVAFVGGLVFVQRIPTTPHALVPAWLKSLDALEALNLRTLVPSHGPVQTTAAAARDGIGQTRRYLQWLDQHFSRWAAQGWEMNEVLRAPVPAEFRDWAAFRTEYVRNVAHLYPVYEQQVLGTR
ncbi:quinoprotein relay system zinc metallohydrolase 1 [Sphaerotilus sp.]|uniref:quinoprotein relay system zinc metallohydrolase 1 n=1 Tax=Sphaerotilus sp. TaxID=2093942 RepID=UPI002ACEFDBF|nr:quinoprotein relay system zinc metallohydrolase 1 [Sphaerotilus sp.]MDZ7856046.1 quinoprotein relay system zinc metallohydrolase 1 [Sphaerotilus sp.]